MADVSKLFVKAEDAVKRRSFDMAIELYQQILVLDADSEKARLALREAEIKKVSEMGSPSKAVSVIAGIPSVFKGGLYRMLKKHDLASIEYEKILAQNPQNLGVSFKLGRVLEACGHFKSALSVYKGITLWKPDSIEALLASGAQARRLGRIEEALDLFTRARNLNPKDKTASDAVRDLSAEISLKPRQEASSFRDLIKKPGAGTGSAKPASGTEAVPEDGEDVEALQARVGAGTAETEDVLALADALEKKGDVKGQLLMLQKEAKARPKERQILLRFRSANLAALESKLQRLEAREGTAPADLDETRGKVAASRIAYFKTHVEIEPTRSDLRFDLGVLHFEKQEIDEAISCFQQAKKDPKQIRDASFWLGRAFLEKGKYKMAVNQLEGALGERSILDLQGKETLYFLGKARIASGDPEGARKNFERIYEEDIHFRDVDRILDELG